MSTLDEQRVWLVEADFRPVECWYKSYSFAAYGGYKQDRRSRKDF